MKVLMLGPYRQHFVDFFQQVGDSVSFEQRRIESTEELACDFIVSYGYRYIIKPQLIERFRTNLINLHISFLPWNRGADPNLWSILEDTPKGVTIHRMTERLDEGDILLQEEVPCFEDDTLSTLYTRLSVTIEQLFFDNWHLIKGDLIDGIPQPGGGTYHRSRDREEVSHLLVNGWDTPVRNLLGWKTKR